MRLRRPPSWWESFRLSSIILPHHVKRTTKPGVASRDAVFSLTWGWDFPALPGSLDAKIRRNTRKTGFASGSHHRAKLGCAKGCAKAVRIKVSHRFAHGFLGCDRRVSV